MIKRTIEISRQTCHLSARNGQLELRFPEAEPENTSIPCEDIGMLLVDNAHVTYSHHALCELLSNAAVVVFCGRDHLPAGMLVPFSGHTEVVARLRDQMSVRRPLKKRLWQQLVSAKIRGQAANLHHDHGAAVHLRAMARRVRSGDPSNVEAQAAKVYWRAWKPAGAETFRRNPDGTDPLNAMLNYGYAVLRAAVARALVAAGLHPALGLHHANRSNAFCLADDLMEPLRPLLDARVRAVYEKGEREVSPPVKRELLSVLTASVETSGTTGPLMVSLKRMAASLVRCYRGEERCLVIPGAVSCGP